MNTQANKAEENNTVLPDNVEPAVENQPDYEPKDSSVHNNANEPAQLNALVYTQGTNIHLVSGQEKHLPHEAWHVIQQKQVIVKQTK